MYLLLLLLNVVIIEVVEVSSKTEYLVLTDECKIPNFPAFSDEANEIFAPKTYTSCSDSEPLTVTTVEDNNTAILRLVGIDDIYSDDPPTCCYSYVTRNGTEEDPDVGISATDCTYFNTTVQLENDTIWVKCEKDSNIVYENVHRTITITEEVQEKLKKQPITNDHNLPISVLILVIDSVSRLNFNRTMPLTRKFLLNKNFIDFKAYNKIDDNTFPNSMALLSGLNLKQVYSLCDPKEVGKLDECPMIWYDFQKLGYVTAYAEDWAAISTFNYQKKGFQNPPTDYYFKPYVEAAETLNLTEKDGMLYCTGPETEGERILNLAKDFAFTFKDKPSFGIFWMNTFSHNDINAPSGMDEKVANFLEELSDENIIRDSMVMVLSDHGIRFGKFQQTIQGWFEERLPLNFVSVPSWFPAKFSTEYNTLLKNANKLVSTYDLYMTLQDVLKKSVNSYNVSSSAACPKCKSLFSNIPRNRSCRDAGIPEAWCACVGEFSKEDPRITEEVNNKASELAVKEIRRWLEYEEPLSTSVTEIISSAVTVNRVRKSYLLFVVQTNTNAIYQILFRIKGDPVKFVRIVKAKRLF